MTLNPVRPVAIFFDLDDTLITNTAFGDAKEKLFETLRVRHGFDAEQVEAVLFERELHNIALSGFAKDRFPKSFVEAYQALCRHEGIPQDAHLRWQIEGFAWEAVTAPSRVMEGVEETLRVLSEDGHRLYVVTKGDTEIQRSKIVAASLSHYFDSVFVYPNKTEVEIAQALAQTGEVARESWFVGNSKKSDINPSLRLGMRAAYIPFDTWRFEEEDLLDGYHLVPHIRELPRVVHGLVN